MGNHNINLSNEAENIWSLNFGKGRWGYQKFSHWVTQQLEKLDKDRLSIEDLKLKIKESEKLIHNHKEELSELKQIIKKKEEKEKEKYTLSEEERWWLADTKKVISNNPNYLESRIQSYINKFNKEFKLSEQEFKKLMNQAIKELGIVE